MTQHGVLAIGLDGYEISYAEELMAAGDLPVLADRRSRDAFLLPDGLGDITKMGGSEGSLERLLSSVEPLMDLPKVLETRDM